MSSFDPRKRMLVLAALLMAPLGLGGCSAQLADLPIVGTPASPALAPGVACVAFVPPSRPAGGRVQQAPRTGRAPPRVLLTVEA